MPKYNLVVFWLYLILTLITGSLALPVLNAFNLKLLLGLPLLLALLAINNQQPLLINKRLVQWLLIFSTTVLISSLFSQHFLNTRTELIKLLAGISLLLFGALYRQYLQKSLSTVLIGLGVFYSLIYLLLTNFPQLFAWLMPKTGYNLVFPSYALHNHLGDFLALPIICLIYQTSAAKRAWLNYGWLAIFGLLVFYSYSRSSYTALSISVLFFLYRFRQKIKPSVIFVGLVLIASAVLFLLITTKETGFQQPWLNAVENKQLFNGRDQYWQVSVSTLKDHPWFGIGLGNFVYAMGRYSNIAFNWTESSLNLFLTIISETGVLAFITFMALLIWIIKNNRFGLPFFLFLALLVNFQTDYTYKITTMWLLFWLIMGLSVNNKNDLVKIKPDQTMLPGLLTILVLLQLTLSGIFFDLKKPFLAVLIDPLNKPAQEQLIVKQLFGNQIPAANWQLSLYQRLYRADASTQYAAANFYLAQGKFELALSSFYQAYLWNPHENLDLYRKIYKLEKSLNGPQAGRTFLTDYKQKVKRLNNDSYFAQLIIKDWREFSLFHK